MFKQICSKFHPDQEDLDLYNRSNVNDLFDFSIGETNQKQSAKWFKFL